MMELEKPIEDLLNALEDIVCKARGPLTRSIRSEAVEAVAAFAALVRADERSKVMGELTNDRRGAAMSRRVILTRVET